MKSIERKYPEVRIEEANTDVALTFICALFSFVKSEISQVLIALRK